MHISSGALVLKGKQEVETVGAGYVDGRTRNLLWCKGLDCRVQGEY